MIVVRYSSLLLLAAASAATLAQSPKPLNLVMPHGTGRVEYTSSPDWKIETFSLYDEGSRPALQINNAKTGVSVSYILFPNDTGAPTPESCRDAVVEPILKNLSLAAETKNDRKSTYMTPSGTSIVVRSYLIAKMGGAPIQDQNVYGFFGDASTCAEIHISKSLYKADDQHLLDAELDRFQYKPGYQSSTQDYFALATIFFSNLNSPGNASPYYQSALDSLPPAPANTLKVRRVLTDQLAMSYGMTGNLKKSRAVATAAIGSDPDYPLNYYNLACADAEQGHAKDAQLHLQQAFDRKANALPGETLPDPTKDDSILKLKKDRTFWAFVQTLK